MHNFLGALDFNFFSIAYPLTVYANPVIAKNNLPCALPC